jgi:hypothetical protein
VKRRGGHRACEQDDDDGKYAGDERWMYHG